MGAACRECIRVFPDTLYWRYRDMRRPVVKAAAVHDLSGYGRASLSIALPVLATLGVQVCPLPTALLSTQTSGFTSYHYRDLTDDMYLILKHWKEIGLSLDAIYSGFLGSSRQISCVTEMIRSFASPEVLVVIDPVMGDEGTPYDPITPEHIEGMKHLISHADVITPNYTEAALLLGEPYRETVREEEVLTWLDRLRESGPSRVVITSVPVEGMEKSCIVYASDANSGDAYRLVSRRLPAAYPGSGDMFASILTGSLLQDSDFLRASARAAEFVSKAIQAAIDDRVPEREGVLIEPILQELARGKVTFTWERLG